MYRIYLEIIIYFPDLKPKCKRNRYIRTLGSEIIWRLKHEFKPDASGSEQTVCTYGKRTRPSVLGAFSFAENRRAQCTQLQPHHSLTTNGNLRAYGSTTIRPVKYVGDRFDFLPVLKKQSNNEQSWIYGYDLSVYTAAAHVVKFNRQKKNY